MQTIKSLYCYYSEAIQDSLLKNSFFISLSRLSDVGFGFFFWLFAAKIYTIEDVGIACALIAFLDIIIVLSRLGFDNSLIRFIPLREPKDVFNTSFWVTCIASSVLSIVFLLTIPLISPTLLFIKNYSLSFIVIVIACSITFTTGFALMALRRSDLRFLQSLTLGIRIPLLAFLIIFGSLGIFLCVGIGYLIAAFVGLLIIGRIIPLTYSINREYIKESFNFNVLSYFASLTQVLPTLIIPILILNILGSQNAAQFSVAFAIGNIIYIIPTAIGTSFFVEGSHGINLRKGAIRALTAIYALLVPAVFVILLFGDWLLGLFGVEYIAGLELLKFLAISSIFGTIYYIFVPLQTIKMKIKNVVLINFVGMCILLSLCYCLMIPWGLAGIGVAFLVTYIILGTCILIWVKSLGWI
jgi:O-antigen/teichoic acid export membrane protein